MREESSENYVKDVGLIEKKLKQRVKKISEKTSQRPRKIAYKAFKRGFASYAAGTDKIPRIDEEELVEDSFSYRAWQLNIYEDVSSEYPGIQWSEVKSAFIERGLNKLNL